MPHTDIPMQTEITGATLVNCNVYQVRKVEKNAFYFTKQIFHKLISETLYG